VARLVVDTGFLVALYRRADALHDEATQFLRASRAQLISASPVIIETCYFLNIRGKVALLNWIAAGGLSVAEVPQDAYPALAAQLEKCSNLDIDFADAALIWPAELAGEHQILTVDHRDFSTFRLKGRKRFDPLHWYD
jgi:predicted nucleic acid-binding protein